MTEEQKPGDYHKMFNDLMKKLTEEKRIANCYFCNLPVEEAEEPVEPGVTSRMQGNRTVYACTLGKTDCPIVRLYENISNALIVTNASVDGVKGELEQKMDQHLVKDHGIKLEIIKAKRRNRLGLVYKKVIEYT